MYCFMKKKRKKAAYSMLLFVGGRIFNYIPYDYTQAHTCSHTHAGSICICIEFVWKYIQKRSDCL